ncbi:MAG TPA: ABC transporter ATP-binding protein, partial [Plasticicumulans sp.]|nr:ABC transporter ATP-binding protein [Plasticicumulans sp.]
LGPSGSGKTTLLNLIGGIDRADQGEVVVAGQPYAQLSDDLLTDFRARNIGFVFQNFNLMPVLTAVENVEYPLQLLGERRRTAAARAMLEAVGLGAQADQYPNELSGGQQQRVAIARALVHRPALLIADEPTAALDSTTGAQVLELMLALSRDTGTTLVVCTHDRELLARAERRVLMRDGRIEHDSGALPAQAANHAAAAALPESA